MEPIDATVTGPQNPPEDTSPQSANPGSTTPDRVHEIVKRAKLDMERTFSKRTETIKQEAVRDYLAGLGFDGEEFEAAQEKIKGALGAPDEVKQTKRALEKVLAEKSKLEADLGKIEAERRESALKAEVLRIASDKAIDPANVYFALKGRGSIGWSDGKMVAFDNSGDADEQLEKHVTKFIEDHASFQKVTSPSGAGSRPGQNGKGAKPSLLTREGRYQDYLDNQKR